MEALSQTITCIRTQPFLQTTASPPPTSGVSALHMVVNISQNILHVYKLGTIVLL
jgi:hypothetical protein